MQSISLQQPVLITDEENDEYIVRLEQLSAYHSLRLALRDHPQVMDEVGITEQPPYQELYNKTYQGFTQWWDRMDEKYMLVHDENTVLMVDVNKKVIFPHTKTQNAG